MRPAIFFDRDGTLNEEVGYAGKAEEFHIYPFAAEAVRLANQAGWGTVLITNQAGVARGFYTEAAIEQLHQLLMNHLRELGARLDGLYYCPHHPRGAVEEYTKVCACRKPMPGMLQQAAEDLDLDLSASWVIGDRSNDIGAAHAVGAKAMLVRTGYGETELAAPDTHERPDQVADDVLAAVRWILSPRQP